MLKNCNAKSIKVISRWRKHDLICGISDFETYKICKEFDADFGISLDLHGKVYCVDNQIFVGSANLTSKGMALTKNFNDEFGIKFTAGTADMNKLQDYLENVVWVDDKLAALILEELDRPRKSNLISSEKWSSQILDKIQKPTTHLWVHELPFSKPEDILNFNASDESQVHDFDLFNFDIDNLTKAKISKNYRESNSFRWLNSILMNEESVSFGYVSSRLHSAILDDPTPYRKDIKKLVSNLFSWFDILYDYEVFRPNYSQVLRKIKD
jgi:hypothetical protein